MTVNSNPKIRGSVDVVSRFGVSGWAADDQAPERKVVVLVHVGDEVVCAAVGNKFRSDLADAGIGSGHHAFSCVFPTPIDNASLKGLRLSADGKDLPLHPAAGTEGDRLFVLPTRLSTGEYLDAGWQDRDFSEYGEQSYILRFFAENPEAPRYCVDLGAYDGVISSQSRALFLRGWAGVLVEPDPRTFARLAVLYSDRPDVTCVRCAISDEPGVAHMNFTAGPPQTEHSMAWQFAQVNTLTDGLAEHYSSSFDYKFERHPVPVATLTGLLDWVHAPADIGFLSIDCNGVDLRIVRALDFARCRPWLIAVECDDNTRPEFEAALAPVGYRRYAATRANTLFSLCSPGTRHKADESEGPRVCSSTIVKGESSEKKASSTWCAESITDAIYRTKFVDVPDIIADWTREYGGIAGRDVLDFGCGEATTALAMVLRRGACRVVAVEIHEEIDNCARYARQQLGLECLPANLELKRIAADTSLDVFGSFDVVYSWSVFEHVSQELIGDCFVKIRRVLRPGGIMFLQTTPLFFSSEGSHFKPWVPEPWAHLSMQQDQFLAALRAAAHSQEQADHLWQVYMSLNRATAPGLLRAAAEAGFEVIREYRTYDEIPVPEPLLEVYTREALTTQQLVFLARARR